MCYDDACKLTISGFLKKGGGGSKRRCERKKSYFCGFNDWLVPDFGRK